MPAEIHGHNDLQFDPVHSASFSGVGNLDVGNHLGPYCERLLRLRVNGGLVHEHRTVGPVGSLHASELRVSL